MGRIFLNESEIRTLTGRVRYTAQIRALIGMGVEHVVRPDGKPIVLRSHVEAASAYPKGRTRRAPWSFDPASVR